MKIKYVLIKISPFRLVTGGISNYLIKNSKIFTKYNYYPIEICTSDFKFKLILPKLDEF